MGLIPKEPPSEEELAARGIGGDKAADENEAPVKRKRGRPPKKKD